MSITKVGKMLCIAAISLLFFITTHSTAQSNKPPQVEVVFVLDTTGSMGGLIRAAKQKIWSIANTLATAKPTPHIKIGLVGYRDRTDTYITKISQMSSDLDVMYSALMSFRAGGGGDGPESVNQALHEAITKIKWSQNTNVYKVVYLVGDAPPHMDYQNDIRYQQTCKLAKEKDIIINTIQCGSWSSTAQFWQDIARLGSGEYFRVSQSGSAVYYKTPYDKELARLSRKLDKTRVYYGDRGTLKKVKERMRKSSSIYTKADVSSVAQRAEFNAKASGRKNFLGSNELVDDVINKKVKIENIKKEHLPTVLKNMPASKRASYIKKQAVKRSKIQKQILALSKKRQIYIKRQVALQKNRGKDSLDMKIYKSIKKQASKKSLIYNEGVSY